MSRFEDERWAAIDAGWDPRDAVIRDREQLPAHPYMCGELYIDDDYDPPSRPIRNVITDLANWQPAT